MTRPWMDIASAALGALADAVVKNPTTTEPYARANVERARAELRQGRRAAADAILDATLARLQRLVTQRPDPEPRLELTRAVVLTLRGQGLELDDERELALEHFRAAVQTFERVPPQHLSSRDHSDYGVALAAIGEVAEARRHIELARASRAATPEASRLLAQLCYANGDVEEAEPLLRESLLINPDDPDALALLGLMQSERHDVEAVSTLGQAAIAYLRRGRPKEALRVLTTVGDHVWGDRLLTAVRAEALHLTGRFEEALADYNVAVASGPVDPWLLHGRATTLTTLGRLNEAQDDLRTAIESAPESVELWVAAGEVAIQLRETAKAHDCAARAVSLDGGTFDSYWLLARAENLAGSADSALEAVRKAQSLDSAQHLELLRLRAQLERRAGTRQAAVQLMRELCALSDSESQDHIALVHLLVDLGQEKDALEVAEGAAARWPEDPDLLVPYGRLLKRAGRTREAVEVLRRSVELAPHSSRGRLQYARALAAAGAVDEALHEVDEAAVLDLDSAEPLRAKRKILTKLGRIDDAVPVAERELVLNPHSIGARIVLAKNLIHSDPEQAEKMLLEVTVANPDDVESRFLYISLLSQREPVKALRLLRREPPALPDAPDLEVEWLLLRGRLYGAQREWSEAEADLDRVTRTVPDLVEGWMARAEVARSRAELGAALDFVDQAVRRRPDHVAARCLRADVLTKLNRQAEARRDLEQVLARHPHERQALLLMSRAVDEPEAARSYLERALAARPDDRSLRVQRAWLEVRLGDYGRALHMFDQLVGENRDAQALAGKADALRLLGHANAAVGAATEAVERSPDQENLRSLALAKVAAGRTFEAIEILTDAHKLRPEDVDTATDLGYALAVADRYDAALELFDRTVAEHPKNTWVLGHLASMLNDLGQFDEAARLARRGVDLAPGDPDLWSTLGWALERQDTPDLPGAEEAYRRRLELLGPAEDPWALKGIANTYHLRGDTRQARLLYERALQTAYPHKSLELAMLPLIGWCQFRLGDLQNAARAFLESSSMEALPGSDTFDLPLVLLCDGRYQRAQSLYADAIGRIRTRHPLRQRGYLAVALGDLRQALIDDRQLGTLRVAQEIDELLTSYLTELPTVSPLRSLGQAWPTDLPTTREDRS